MPAELPVPPPASSGDPFVHLHVASGYSLRYGVNHPHELVARAAEYGMDALALTDRDGLYGAVKFVKACRSAGLRPLLGVDLAVAPEPFPAGERPAGPGAAARGVDPAANGRARNGRAGPGAARRTPARGGAFVDHGHPRVTLLARPGGGWAALCRLVSATHLAGERGRPVGTPSLIAEHAADLVLLLGPDSDVGRVLAARRPGLAAALLSRWRAAFAPGDVLVEVVHHHRPGDPGLAARAALFAREVGVPAVLTGAVRHLDRSDAPVADVLDAARRLVALDARHVDRVNAEGYLARGKEMAGLADEIGRAAGDERIGRELLARTRWVADRCALDPRTDLGIGEIHFPELTVQGLPGAATDAGLADSVLRERCLAGFGRRGMPASGPALARLTEELTVVRELGYPAYFLTVADVTDLIRSMGVRCAARGSGAGSLVTYLLGISDVDPLRYGLLMERFLSPLRRALPDIDVDVESARRTEVYERILDRYGGDRCACVSMMDTYRARHAIRDVGGALGLPPAEVDAIAKAFPHVRASQLAAALADLPELRASGLADPSRAGQLDQLFRLAERLDGLPRHIALHPCGVLLSDATLLDRTPVEASWLGFPMSQFDKDDVEDLGLLKLDVLGVRMQSAIAHALGEIERVGAAEGTGEGTGTGTGRVDIDAIPRDDSATFALIASARTLGCFQIESPGQRELIGKFGPATFDDLIVDISLFRPGPVKSDMVTPFLEARNGWRAPSYLHPDLEPALAETCGVVVFHEQVIRIVSILTGCSLAEGDEARRALGDPEGQEEVRAWFFPAALRAGYDLPTVEAAWEVLRAFASFGFCKAHAAAFALPTYQSAWLKAHHPAAFLAGVLTHDPGMYPKRLILGDARQAGIAVLPLDVNASDAEYRVERVEAPADPPARPGEQARLGEREPGPAAAAAAPLLPDGRGYGIRLALADVKGITSAEVARIVAGRPYASLADFWHRARVSRPVVERLVLAGGFDAVHGIGAPHGAGGPRPATRRRGVPTRRDLLLQVVELDTYGKALRRGAPARRRGAGRPVDEAAAAGDVRALAARQSQAPAAVGPVEVQLAIDLGDAPDGVAASGLPEMSPAERVRAELDVLGLDASAHVLEFYEPFLAAVGVTRARDLLRCRSRAEILVAGVKVATQTPPIRSGRRVVFLTLDDATGPVDATFFAEAQAAYAATVFHSWLLVVRGRVRRTGPRGVSLQATGCWELPRLRDVWEAEGIDGVHRELGLAPDGFSEAAVRGAAESRATRPVVAPPPGAPGRRYASGAVVSPYADVRPAGGGAKDAPRRLWHASPGSSGG